MSYQINIQRSDPAFGPRCFWIVFRIIVAGQAGRLPCFSLQVVAAPPGPVVNALRGFAAAFAVRLLPEKL